MAKAEKIEIIEKWCKGCEICVELCPTGALEMRDFKAAVKDLENVLHVCNVSLDVRILQ